ncbi:MAG: cytochrome c553 [Sulfurimonas sp.]|jgi:cytochrome c553
MKQKNIIIFLTSIIMILTLSACSDENTTKTIAATETVAASEPVASTEAVAESAPIKYTMEQVYNEMCIKCHSTDGSGNTERLVPSMKGFAQNEIEEALLEVEDDNGHVVMEHNREQILKKGMEYSAKEMSAYMFKRFNK